VWYRTTGLPDNAAKISFYPLGDASLKASSEWKEFSTTLQARDHTDFGIYLSNYGVGDVWYDDAKLTREGSGVNLLKNPGLEVPQAAQAPAFLTDGVPFSALPAFAKFETAQKFADATVQTGAFGRGRVAVLNGLRLPNTQAWTPAVVGGALYARRLDYDYYLTLPMRMILWAAHKEPDVKIQAPAAAQIAREKGGSLQFAISPLTNPQDINATFIIRDRDNNVMSRQENVPFQKAAATGSWTANLRLPQLPAGDYFVDLLLRKNGATVNWASTSQEVTSQLNIAKVELSKPAFSRSEAVSGTITLDHSAPASAKLLVRQIDNYGRLVAKSTFNAKGTSIPFSIKSASPLSVLQYLDVSLIDGKDTLDRTSVTFSLNDFYPPRDDIRWVMWDSMDPNSYTGQTIAKQFEKIGIDTQYTSFSPWALRANMWDLPYMTRFVDKKTESYSATAHRDKDDLARDPVLVDPDYRSQLRADLLKKAEDLSRFSTQDFALGDENHFVLGRYDLSFSPADNADFIEWAKREYNNDLTKLNAEYGTQYKSWSEVHPITLEEAQKTGNYAPWVDHRLHMESEWAGIHSYARDVIREVVPTARVGYEGSDSRAGAFYADDYWKLMRAMNLNNIYYRDFQAVAVRDFADPSTMYGAGWYGGYPDNRNDVFMRWFPWMALFNGSNSFWVWNGYGSAGSVMSFDTSLYPFFATNAREMQEIKGGTGKLLMDAKQQDDGVAILWSPSSVHVREFTPGMPDIDDALNSTVRALHDLNIEPRVLSYAQINQLTSGHFKVLFLIEAQALSDQEVAAITKFVQNGGTVIADLRPGVRDEHGKPRAQNALDALFGVQQNVDAPKLQMAQRLPGFDASKLQDWSASVTDASLRLNGGKSTLMLGDVPTFVTHQFGKGHAVLFNLSWSDYLKREQSADDAHTDYAFWPLNKTYRDALQNAMKMTPPVSISPAMPRVQVARYRAGNLEYVGILPGLPRDAGVYGANANPAKLPQTQISTVHFARAAYLYDVRAGKFLGKTAQIKTPLQAGQARLFALLPYRVDALKVLSSRVANHAANVQLNIAASSGKPGRHIVQVRFVGPDRKERAYYRRNVELENGRARFTQTFALNDQAGVWTIEAKDIASGVRGKMTLRVP
jgi:hypothetical protein